MNQKEINKEQTEKGNQKVYIYFDRSGVVHTTSNKYFIKD